MGRDLLTKIVLFAAGAGTGSAVTYKVLSTKYDRLIQEEIDSVKASFGRGEVEQTEKPVEENSTDDEDAETVKDIVNQNSYVTVSDNKVEEEDEEVREPYVISPDEFGDSDYTVMSLWYYTDGVVTNDAGKIIANVEELIGSDFADHFGEYEEDPDTVYVQNDEQQIVYEVMKEYREFLES